MITPSKAHSLKAKQSPYKGQILGSSPSGPTMKIPSREHMAYLLLKFKLMVPTPDTLSMNIDGYKVSLCHILGHDGYVLYACRRCSLKGMKSDLIKKRRRMIRMPIWNDP